jgi:tripartite-type tricarboxylate transporter receptor subunit TctC
MKRLVDLGYVVLPDQPEEFDAFIKADLQKMSKLVKHLGLVTEK